MEGYPKPQNESIEEAPVFEYTFYDYTNRLFPEVIFTTPVHNNEEAFREFEIHFNRKFGTKDTDGFIRQ